MSFPTSAARSMTARQRTQGKASPCEGSMRAAGVPESSPPPAPSAVHPIPYLRKVAVGCQRQPCEDTRSKSSDLDLASAGDTATTLAIGTLARGMRALTSCRGRGKHTLARCIAPVKATTRWCTRISSRWFEKEPVKATLIECTAPLDGPMLHFDGLSTSDKLSTPSRSWSGLRG